MQNYCNNTVKQKLQSASEKLQRINLFLTVVSERRGEYLPKNLNKSKSHCIALVFVYPIQLKELVDIHILNFPNGPKSSYLLKASLINYIFCANNRLIRY